MKKILTIKQASFKILLGGEHRSVKTFMPLVENFVEQMPELMPDVWDIIEPFKRPFTIDNIRKTWTDWENSYVQRFHDRYIPNPKLSKQTNWSGVSLDFFWKRKLAPKAWGGFSRLFWSDDCTRHAYVFMDVDVKRSYEEKIIEHLKQTSILFNGHYGYFDSMTPEYEEVARANETRSVGISVYSHRLQKKLPDIFWCQVFGAPYVRLFGLEKLLSAPAFKVEQLGPEMVYIQLSESLFDMHERYAEIDAVRQRVKAHLDDNIFFKPENAENHVYRTPDFQFPEVPTEPKESLL